jgi:ankyrin repeat protein
VLWVKKGRKPMMTQRLSLTLAALLFFFSSAPCMSAFCQICCLEVVPELTKLLIQAIEEHNQQRVIEQLDKGADPDAVDEETGYTPLALACEQGDPAIVTALALQSSNINKAIHPVKSATYGSINEAAKPLLDAREEFESHNGYTPIQIAASHGNLQCMQILLNRGAIITKKTCDGKNAMDLYAEYTKRHERSASAEQKAEN